VIPLLAGGSVHDALKRIIASPSRRSRPPYTLSMPFAYLHHEFKALHRDTKPGNVPGDVPGQPTTVHRDPAHICLYICPSDFYH
jgi:hypothetical protein